MKKYTLAQQVSAVLYGPPMMAFALVVVQYVAWGVSIYIFFLAAGYKLGLLKNLRDWPWISRITLFLSPLLMGLGLYLSTVPPASAGWMMMIAIVIYLGLSAVGYAALIKD